MYQLAQLLLGPGGGDEKYNVKVESMYIIQTKSSHMLM
jgi:hypothetical protein